MDATSDTGSGIHMSGALLFFWLELAEILRRWMWVFLRVEWECVRRLEESASYGEDAVDGMELNSVRVDSRTRDGVDVSDSEERRGSMLFDAGKEEQDPP